jgi:hypothetical protein
MFGPSVLTVCVHWQEKLWDDFLLPGRCCFINGVGFVSLKQMGLVLLSLGSQLRSQILVDLPSPIS